MKNILVIAFCAFLFSSCRKEIKTHIVNHTKEVEPKQRMLRVEYEVNRFGYDTLSCKTYHYSPVAGQTFQDLDSVRYYVYLTAGKHYYQTAYYTYLDIDHRKVTFISPEFDFTTYYIEQLDFERNVIRKQEFFIENDVPVSLLVYDIQ